MWYCSSSHCVRILDASTARSSTAQRVDYRAKLYVDYLLDAEAKGVEPVGRSFFYDKWPEEIGDASKERDCICGTCHWCGTRTFDAIHVLCDTILVRFSDVPGTQDAISHVRTQTELVRQTFERDFHHHHALQSSTATHCRHHGLSSPHGPEQGSPCEPEAHRDDNGQPRSDVLPYEEAPDHWGQQQVKCAQCNRGGADGGNWPVMCDFCTVTYHNTPACLGGESPVDTYTDGFTCRECVAKRACQLHSMDCEKCNARHYLVADSGLLLDFLGGEALGHQNRGDVAR